MLQDTSSSQDASTHQIWDSYLKEYNKRYAPYTINLKTRSEVKVTVTRKWKATLRHPKMNPNIKFGTPTSKNTGDMHRTRSGPDWRTDIVITIKTKSEVKVTVTGKWYWTTPLFQDASTYQIWNSYLKEHRRYAPDTKWDGQTDSAITICLPNSFGGIKRLIYGIYLFHFESVSKSNDISWRCSTRSCKVSLRTDSAMISIIPVIIPSWSDSSVFAIYATKVHHQTSKLYYIGKAPITHPRTCVIKIVTFKGGNLMW